MKILILGGTGAIGIHLTELLANTDFDVMITTRSSRESKYKNISYVEGGAKNVDFVTSLLKEDNCWDAIIDFMSYTTEEFTSRYEMFLNSTKQYIFLSSSRVYADCNGPITENSPRLLDICEDKNYIDTDEYALAKARQENILFNSGRKNWTIIRPYITYAENRLQLGILEKEHWLYRALKGRTIVFSSEINSRFTTFTYGFDVANGIIAIIGKDGAYGEAFHITSNQTIKWNDALTIYLDVLEQHLGKRPKVLLIDHNELERLGYSKFQINYDRMFNRIFDNSKISKYINVDEFVTVKIGLEKCLTTLIEGQEFGLIGWGIEARKDKITNERASLSKINGLRNKFAYIICRYTNLKK